MNVLLAGGGVFYLNAPKSQTQLPRRLSQDDRPELRPLWPLTPKSLGKVQGQLHPQVQAPLLRSQTTPVTSAALATGDPVGLIKGLRHKEDPPEV